MAADIPEQSRRSRELLDVLIRAGLVAVLTIFCYHVFKPFLDLMLWALILAITLYPLHLWLKAHIGGRNVWSATLLTVFGILVMVIPIYFISVSAFGSIQDLMHTAKSGTIHIPPPPADVADWPLIGKQVHGLWTKASADLAGFLQPLAPQIRSSSLHLVGTVAGLGIVVLVFMAALAVAGIILVFGEQGHRAALRISTRVFGPVRGPDVAKLCTQTVRTVAQGVVGIAFIQMVLVGVAFLIKGVPAAGLLCLMVLVLGIIQVPATIVTIPVIAFVFYKEGATGPAIAFGVYTFVAGLADNVLKPILLGRGVDVPMPVILIGALGGMVSNGIIGLFIGPIALAVGYRLFWQWVDLQEPAPGVDTTKDAPKDAVAP